MEEEENHYRERFLSLERAVQDILDRQRVSRGLPSIDSLELAALKSKLSSMNNTLHELKADSDRRFSLIADFMANHKENRFIYMVCLITCSFNFFLYITSYFYR